MILTKIIDNKQKEIREAKKNLPLRSFKPKLEKSKFSFKNALSKKRLNLIAEIKRGSPSEGLIRKKFEPIRLAKIYQDSGASAISVLTDKRFFKGDLAHLLQARLVANVPLLRKDFIIDKYQIYESRLIGADAILLIARILTGKQIKEFIKIASKYRMGCLVEVHDKKELKKALDAGADIIGINNRNLNTLKININTTLKLINKIPKNKVIVSESGFLKRKDIDKVRGKVNAVLIGTVFMRSKDIKKKIKELL